MRFLEKPKGMASHGMDSLTCKLLTGIQQVCLAVMGALSSWAVLLH